MASRGSCIATKKSHNLCMVCYLGDQTGWLSTYNRCFFTRSGRRVLIRLSSVTYCTSMLTSQCQYCCCIHRHSKKGLSYIIFDASSFSSKAPKCQFQKDVKYLVVLSKPCESHHFQPIPSPYLVYSHPRAWSSIRQSVLMHSSEINARNQEISSGL